jgi:hypothetical protein
LGSDFPGSNFPGSDFPGSDFRSLKVSMADASRKAPAAEARRLQAISRASAGLSGKFDQTRQDQAAPLI